MVLLLNVKLFVVGVREWQQVRLRLTVKRLNQQAFTLRVTKELRLRKIKTSDYVQCKQRLGVQNRCERFAGVRAQASR